LSSEPMQHLFAKKRGKSPLQEAVEKEAKRCIQAIQVEMRREDKSRRDIANELGLSYTPVSKWINGKALPTSKSREKIKENYL